MVKKKSLPLKVGEKADGRSFYECLVQKKSLPLKVGEKAEARSFDEGFRGAWFRCKIREIRLNNGDIEYLLEYFDFTDEALELLNAYQVPVPWTGKPKENQGFLMIRPAYPSMYRESEMPCVRDISDVAVIVNDAWKVGDLVDWWTRDCFWTGKITTLIGDDKAMLEFPKPPFGEGKDDEGKYDEALLKDLRPSLDWSPEHSWVVPAPGGETGRPCARLIKPGDLGKEMEAVNMKAGSSPYASLSSHTSVITLAASDELKVQEAAEIHELSLSSEELDPQETSANRNGEDINARKPCLSDTNSSSHVREEIAQPMTDVAEGDPHFSSGPHKKYRASRGLTSNSMRSKTLESAVLDLEELVNKVKWLKSILNNGVGSIQAARPQWKVHKHIVSSSGAFEM